MEHSMTRRILTALRWTSELLFVGLLGAVAAAVVFNSILPALGAQVVVLHGGSMSPAYPIGAVVVEEKVAPEAVREGDVITFRGSTGVTVTHRVVRVVETTAGPVFETKGDANGAGDPGQVPGQWVSGRAVFGLPLLGFLIALLGIPSGFVTILSLAATFLLASTIAADVLTEDARQTIRGARARHGDDPAGTSDGRAAHAAAHVEDAGSAEVAA
jgi:signal peptidase I